MLISLINDIILVFAIVQTQTHADTPAVTV